MKNKVLWNVTNLKTRDVAEKGGMFATGNTVIVAAFNGSSYALYMEGYAIASGIIGNTPAVFNAVLSPAYTPAISRLRALGLDIRAKGDKFIINLGSKEVEVEIGRTVSLPSYPLPKAR